MSGKGFVCVCVGVVVLLTERNVLVSPLSQSKGVDSVAVEVGRTYKRE